MPPIKVLVVDDSAFMRQIISRMLEADPEVCVVGVARDGEDALVKLDRLNPDVLTVDLEMPKMGGLDLLAEVMAKKPVPIVVVSAWATAGAEPTIRALELGAVDFVTKPVASPSEAMWDIGPELLAKVKTAAYARVFARTGPAVPIRLPAGMLGLASEAVVCCIAASTGGPRALQNIVMNLPADFPLCVLLVQHMPTGFTRVFANRLNDIAPLSVSEAIDGEEAVPGKVLVAPAGFQTTVTGSPGNLRIKIGKTPTSVYRPSADITLASVAESCGNRALGVLLTGMGQDGARGLLALRKAGGRTIAESEETCVIYGMPRAAVELGAAEFVLPLWEVPEAILTLTKR